MEVALAAATVDVTIKLPPSSIVMRYELPETNWPVNVTVLNDGSVGWNELAAVAEVAAVHIGNSLTV